MVRRLGIVGATAVIGVVWEVWHWIPFMAKGRSWVSTLGTLVLGVLSRTLMVVLYQQGGGNLALACAFHAMLNTIPTRPDQTRPEGFPACPVAVHRRLMD